MKVTRRLNTCSLRSLRWLACAALLLAVGCGNADNNTPVENTNNTTPTNNATTSTNNGTTSTNNGSTSSNNETIAVPTVAMTANLFAFGSSDPLVGVRFCVDGAQPENCGLSGDDGRVTLEVPANMELAFTAEFGAYYPTIFAITSPDEEFELAGLTLVVQAAAAGLLATLDETQDPEKGALAIRVTGPNVTPTLDPDDGGEPWYLVGSEISRSDTGTPALNSFLGISNIAVGEHSLTLEHATSECEVFGWLGDEPGQLRFPVRAGFLTGLFAANCL